MGKRLDALVQLLGLPFAGALILAGMFGHSKRTLVHEERKEER
jgi:hypothetical protein